MTNRPSFDAKAWIVTHAPHAKLRGETLDTVSSFTLMWNLFEQLACNGEASVQAFGPITEYIAKTTRVPEGIAEAVQFWKDRYWVKGQFNDLFSGLNFRPGNRQDLVEYVLSKDATDLHEMVLAALIIVYRLRNNLFHGLKTIDMLNDQVDNLNTASRVLASVLVSAGHVPEIPAG